MKNLLISSAAALALVACSDGELETTDHRNPSNSESPASERDVARQATEIETQALWMRPHPGGRDVTAAYGVLSLVSGSEDLLESVRIDGAERVEIHGHIVGDGGVMRMVELGPQRLGPDDPLVFAPGGLHFMVFGLETVSEGDEVSGVLVFQNAGAIPVIFPVRTTPIEVPSDY